MKFKKSRKNIKNKAVKLFNKLDNAAYSIYCKLFEKRGNK